MPLPPGPYTFINEVSYSSDDVIELLMPASLDHTKLQLMHYLANGSMASSSVWRMGDGASVVSVGAVNADWKVLVVQLAGSGWMSAGGGLALVYM